jgi:tetratricopeptide (TPR) repeat protein
MVGGLSEENSSNEPAEFYNVLGDSVEDGDLDISSLDADIDNIETKELVLEEESPLSSTATLAEIYLEQGLYSQALAMYKELLQDEPDNSEVQNRISEIESMQSESESDNPNDGADLDSPPQKKLRP